jgi:hypothetical protein
MAETAVTRGLGLGNVKKRLAIVYPATHSLTINEDVMSFSVSLEIPLFKPGENLQEFKMERESYELV